MSEEHASGEWRGMTEAAYEAHRCVDGTIVERRGADALTPCPRCPPPPKRSKGMQILEIDLDYGSLTIGT